MRNSRHATRTRDKSLLGYSQSERARRRKNEWQVNKLSIPRTVPRKSVQNLFGPYTLCTHTHTHARTHARTHAQKHTHACGRTHTQKPNKHTHTRARARAHTHTHTHTHARTLAHTNFTPRGFVSKWLLNWFLIYNTLAFVTARWT